MNWWDNALYDTCSLITIDKLLLDHSELTVYFPAVVTIEECLSKDHMLSETAARVRPRVTFRDLPEVTDISRILIRAKLPNRVSEIDGLVYVTGVHSKITVITGDTALARAVSAQKIRAANTALILKDLVQSHVLTETECTTILGDLVKRKDYLLPPREPQTWATLKKYKFP